MYHPSILDEQALFESDEKAHAVSWLSCNESLWGCLVKALHKWNLINLNWCTMHATDMDSNNQIVCACVSVPEEEQKIDRQKTQSFSKLQR